MVTIAYSGTGGEGLGRFRSGLLATASLAMMAIYTPAGHAQDTDGSSSVTPASDIVVTGSRIIRDGYDAPTPVSVISTKEIQQEAPANISDFVNTLPAVRGSGTSASSNGAVSSGQAGINSVNLRNLGANRTLVLFDGQRSVASTTTGTVDVNTFPQALIERVEVVTGGASSAYGSDAVSGVVNFVLNKKFKGFKMDLEHGVTTYGDAPNYKIQATGGQSFMDDRLHVIVSGEYFKQKGVQTIDRDWNEGGFFMVNNPAYVASACTDSSASTICYPEYYVTSGAGTGQFTPGGLITGARAVGATSNLTAAQFAATGLRGDYFGNIDPATGKATVNELAFGQTSGQWMVGGDYNITSAGHRGSATLQPEETRGSLFGRISYDFSDAFKPYVQVSYSRYNGQSFYQQTPTTGVSIRVDNAYLPDATRAAMVANNLSTISIGTSNVDLGPQGSDMTREVYRYVGGFDGRFGLLGSDWDYNAYYQYGLTRTNEQLTNTWNLSRMALATDAVYAPAGNAIGVPAGTIVCRSTLTNPTNGCVPLNRIGQGGVTSEAHAYVMYDGLQPLREQRLSQQVAAVNFSTQEIFSLPAGPVSLAFGAEWREEKVSGYVDPLYQPIVSGGVTTGTWIYGNFLPNSGKYSVKEAFIETIIPIFTGLDFNGAFRATDYSTSGTVTTWKTGLTWQLIPDIKFRGTYSRDIRAPNLNELFAAGTGRTNAVNVPVGNTTRSDQFNESTIGNTALSPETAKTLGLGVVLTPTFLPGFAFSADYYNIKIEDMISSLSAQTLVNLCYEQNDANSCSFISTSAGRGQTSDASLPITSIEIVPFNFVNQEAEGIDFEASYRRPVGPGNMTLRALASYAIKLTTDNGVAAVTDVAGQNSGGLPDWTYRFSAGYDFDSGFSIQGIARGVSSGVYNNNYIVCSTDCPASTNDNRTINTNSIAGAFYYDMNASYNFEISKTKAQLFLSVRNIFNKDPVLTANGPAGNNSPAYPTTTRSLYDVMGRVFRMGLRIRM